MAQRGARAMAGPWTIKAKVCLVGEIAVGKTSLVRRFSQGSFDESYSTTLGINISKKTVEPPSPPRDVPGRVEMVLFDVMGQRNLRELLVESYFKGAQALLAVWDVMRPETLRELPSWIEMAREVAGTIPVVIATNKMDLSPDHTFEADALDDVACESGGVCFTTSAKTGENVEAAFLRLAEDLIHRWESSPPPRPSVGGHPTLESIARGLVEDSPEMSEEPEDGRTA